MDNMRTIRLAGLIGILFLGVFAGCRSAHTTSAILYIDEQSYDKAVRVIHEGFEYTQDEPDAYYYLGEAYSHLAEEAVTRDDYAEATRNYKLAYKAYRRAVEIKPADWEEKVSESLAYNYRTRLGRAKVDWDAKFYEQAEGHMRLAYAALPDSLTPVKSIARMKIQMAEAPEFAERKSALLGEALELLDQVLVSNPDAYELQLDKAYVLAALGRNDEAGRIYDELLAAHSDDADLLIQTANLALDNQDYARAAEFYVRVVNIFEKDTDAGNDADNISMLVAAGTWFGKTDVARFDEAVAAFDRAANLETYPTEGTMLARLRTYYNYGEHITKQVGPDTDPLLKAELSEKAAAVYRRAVEIGGAMTDQFMANAQGFLYLSMAQTRLGDFAAAQTNFKTYEQLSTAATP